MEQGKLFLKLIKLTRYFYLWICMPTRRKKEYLPMAVKIKVTLIFVDKSLSYFGRIFLTLFIINVILWWKLEDKELQGCIYIVSLTLITVILLSIPFVDLQKIKFIIIQRIFFELELAIYKRFINFCAGTKNQWFKLLISKYFKSFIQIKSSSKLGTQNNFLALIKNLINRKW